LAALNDYINHPQAPCTGRILSGGARLFLVGYLLFLTLQLSRSEGENPARGFHSSRVQTALADVCQGLRLVYRESDTIRHDAVDDEPSLTAGLAEFSIERLLNVVWWPSTSSWLLTVGGKNIKPGARMMLVSTRNPADGYEGKVQNAAEKMADAKLPASLLPMHEGVTHGGNFMTAAFDIPTSASLTNTYAVIVVNPDGTYAWLEKAFSDDHLIQP